MEHKLSQLMREGAKHHKQGFDGFIVPTEDGYCTCAWGAIAEGDLILSGNEPGDYSESDIEEVAFALYGEQTTIDSEPERDRSEGVCPACNVYHGGLADCIAHLNDHEHWTREQIAEWLESIGY